MRVLIGGVHILQVFWFFRKSYTTEFFYFNKTLSIFFLKILNLVWKGQRPFWRRRRFRRCRRAHSSSKKRSESRRSLFVSASLGLALDFLTPSHSLPPPCTNSLTYIRTHTQTQTHTRTHFFLSALSGFSSQHDVKGVSSSFSTSKSEYSLSHATSSFQKYHMIELSL